MVALGEVADFIRGINFKPDDVVTLDTPGSVACMRTKNVQTEIDLTDVWAVADAFVRREEQVLQCGDILVSSANSWNLVGKCCWIPQLPYRASFGGFISVLRGKEGKVFNRYLYHWFASGKIQALLRSFGQKTTNISNLNFDRCLKLQIPLSPLEEQKRIAEVLDKAEKLRAKRRAALAQLDTLTQSIFLEMFGDPVTNRKGFPIFRMGDVCDVRDGTHDSPKYVSEAGYPLVTSKNLSGGFVDLSDVNLISEGDYLQINKRSKVDQGDIIMPMIGTIGSPVLVVDEPRFAIKNVALIKFTAASPSQILVRQLLSGDYFDHIVGQKNRGGTQKFVSLGDLRSFPLPIPPIALQQEFAERVTAIEKLKAIQRASLAELETLFAALQHRAFQGEL